MEFRCDGSGAYMYVYYIYIYTHTETGEETRRRKGRRETGGKSEGCGMWMVM